MPLWQIQHADSYTHHTWSLFNNVCQYWGWSGLNNINNMTLIISYSSGIVHDKDKVWQTFTRQIYYCITISQFSSETFKKKLKHHYIQICSVKVCQNLFIAEFVITFQVLEYQLFHILINQAENSASLLQYLKQLLQTPTE